MSVSASGASGTAFEFSKSSFVVSSASVAISLVISSVSVASSAVSDLSASSAVSVLSASEMLKQTWNIFFNFNVRMFKITVRNCQ